MFLVEATAGWLTGSTALLADSLDMLGDASVYAFSLYVVHRGAQWRARAATAKGVIMAVFGVAVLVEAGVKLSIGAVPDAAPMGATAIVALLAKRRASRCSGGTAATTSTCGRPGSARATTSSPTSA